MYTITNLSSNALPLTEGRIAAGESVKRKTLGKKELMLQSTGWLNITEPAEAEEVVIPDTVPEVEATKADEVVTKSDPAQTNTSAEGDRSKVKNTTKPGK